MTSSFAERRQLLALAMSAALLLTTSCASLRAAQLYQRGTRALDRGDVSTAIEDLERAARMIPEASEIQNHLGISYTGAGRFDDAIEAYERALDLDCSNRAARWNLLEARKHGANRSVSQRRDGSDPGGVNQ